MQLATVKYQVATYSGTEKVNCNEDDSDERIIEKAKRSLKRYGGLPTGYQSFRVIHRENLG